MRAVYFLSLLVLLAACNGSDKLPVYGNKTAVTKTENGKTVTDSVDYVIPPFSFVNQDSAVVTEQTIAGKIFVTDFFFTSCPTICPVMKKEMIRVYDKFKGNKEVMILSHTIDPDYDTKEVLRDYAKRLGADGKQWMFLTGKRSFIYSLAEKGYYASAAADSTEPGGFVHSGGFILVDKKLRVRGIYDGTNTQEVDKLMEDMDLLLTEK